MRQRIEGTLRRLRSTNGFTLAELLASSLIAGVVAGGTLMAFVTAARINRVGNTAAFADSSKRWEKDSPGRRHLPASFH